MPTPHDVWDAVTNTDGTPGNSFEFLANLFRADSPTVPQLLVDQTNINPVATAKTRMRQTAASKGQDRGTKYADSWVTTFDVEIVRGVDGLYGPDLQDLIDAAKELGVANQRRMQFFDALGADFAIDGVWSIAFARSGIDWDSAGFYTFTATQSKPVTYITNPVLVGLVPVIGSVLPSGEGAGDTVYIQGSNFGKLTETASNVTFGGTNATSYTVVSDSLITAVLPAGAAGTVDLKVHNPSGDTTVKYTRTV